MQEPNENDLIRDQARAARAEALLRDELLTEAFDKLEKSYTEEMILTGVGEADSYKRDRLHQAIHILRKVRGYLGKVVQDGKVARAHLVQIEGKRQRAA